MIFVELIEGDGNRKKYRKVKNKQRHKTKEKNKNKKKTEQVTSVIKIGICALILNGELYIRCHMSEFTLKSVTHVFVSLRKKTINAIFFFYGIWWVAESWIWVASAFTFVFCTQMI